MKHLLEYNQLQSGRNESSVKTQLAYNNRNTAKLQALFSVPQHVFYFGFVCIMLTFLCTLSAGESVLFRFLFSALRSASQLRTAHANSYSVFERNILISKQFLQFFHKYRMNSARTGERLFFGPAINYHFI